MLFTEQKGHHGTAQESQSCPDEEETASPQPCNVERRHTTAQPCKVETSSIQPFKVSQMRILREHLYEEPAKEAPREGTG